MDIFAQIVGILAMLVSIFSFQMRTHKSIMLMQILCASLFALHYGLIGGMTGCAVNLAAIVRDIIFLFQDKKIFQGKIWTVLFAIIMVGCGVLSWEGPVSLLMMVAMVLNTVSLSMHDPQNVRKVILVASPLALVYNVLSFSIGGLINESLVICSAIIALIRYKKKN